MLDVYMRVFYIDKSLDERFTLLMGYIPMEYLMEQFIFLNFNQLRKNNLILSPNPYLYFGKTNLLYLTYIERNTCVFF